MKRPIRMALLVFALAVGAHASLAQPAPVSAAQPTANPMPAVRADRWTDAEAAVADHPDPVARKLVQYYRLLAPGQARASEIAAFMADQPDWPAQALLDRRRQDALAQEIGDTAVLALCESAPPTQAAAMLRCAAALADAGQASRATALARQAWIDTVTEPAQEATFLRRWAGLPNPDDEWARFQRLAWKDPEAATRQVSRLDPDRQPLAELRLALRRDDATSDAAFAALGASWWQDPGLMLDRARQLRRQGRMAEAVALWRDVGAPAQTGAPNRLGDFWSERHLLTRRLMQDGAPADALTVVAGHGQTSAEVVTEAEFLAGFIALRMLNDPVRASRHFTSLDRASKAAITQGRAHYWLGRSAEAGGGDPTPHFRRAAAWATTFYGQLAALRLGEDRATRDARVLSLRDPTWTPDAALAYGGREVVRAATWLIAWGEAARAKPFLLRMDDLAPVPTDRAITAAVALRAGIPDTAVFVARRVGRDGGMLAEAGWPMPYEPPSDFDAAVALGIMRQESSFDIAAISSSGARGLMQLMPFTAREVAKKLGIPTSLPTLTSDSAHNMRLGTTYLRDMLARFGATLPESLPLAAAAYNAGPHRVDRWVSEIGDPRTGDIALLDWIERIPFNETRNYVQRVLENVVIYRAKRRDPTETLFQAWEGARR